MQTTRFAGLAFASAASYLWNVSMQSAANGLQTEKPLWICVFVTSNFLLIGWQAILGTSLFCTVAKQDPKCTEMHLTRSRSVHTLLEVFSPALRAPDRSLVANRWPVLLRAQTLGKMKSSVTNSRKFMEIPKSSKLPPPEIRGYKGLIGKQSSQYLFSGVIQLG